MNGKLIPKKTGFLLYALLVAAMISINIFWGYNRVWALENGLAQTPPMGWNSWNCFKDKIDELPGLTIIFGSLFPPNFV